MKIFGKVIDSVAVNTSVTKVDRVDRQGAPMGYARCILATQSDTVDEDEVADGVFSNGTDNVEVVTDEGTVVILAALPVGVIVPLRVARVNDTNTTSTAVWLVYAYSAEAAPI